MFGALGTLGIVLGLGFISTTSLVTRATWVDHTHRVIESLDDITINLAEAMNARRGFCADRGRGAQILTYAKAIQGLGDAEKGARAHP